MVDDGLLSIGELAERTGVAITALRYYDDLGLVRPQGRVSGQRRYSQSTVGVVGVVLFLREVGFSLGEIRELVGAKGKTRRWSELLERKLEELAQQQHRLAVARNALEHAHSCPAEDLSRCPRFWTIIDARVAGASLEESHAALH